ncbi:insulinase family protein [bacterium]|nr:insulinase family protein [bacterium]
MRNRHLSIILVFILWAGLTFASQGSEVVETFDVNGLQVIVKPNSANEIVSAQLYIKGGSLNLSESTQGIEPLIFESALKGSQHYSKEVINTLLDKTAAQIVSNSNRDYTAVGMRCLNRFFDQIWDLFVDVILNPAFEEKEVELVREQLLVGIRQRQDDPDSYLNELSDDLFFRGHLYRFDPQGIEESMAAISIEQMRDHLKSNLQTSRLLLVVVGDVGPDQIKRKVEETFGRLPRGDYQSVLPDPIMHEAPALELVQRDLPTNYIQGYFSAPGLSDPDFYPMRMAMNILAWRVFEEVRTKRNLSYAPSAFFSNEFANRAGIYVTTVYPDTTVKVMLAELKKMQEEPVSAKDLNDRIAMYLTQYYLNNETNAAQAQFLARFELSGLGWEAGEGFVENLRNVTAEDVQRVANRYFRNIQFVYLGDLDLIDEDVYTSM